MKKIVFLSLFALCLPWMVSAQSINDDLYYTPSKDKEEKKPAAQAEETVVRSNAPTTIYTPARPVVVQDREGNTRDVDEYNRRYSSDENDFVMKNDTLYVKEKRASAQDGEWVDDFEGSEDDYEYAMRLVRFRNPRYAISISSPYYWDVVYGLNSWDWNVYTDGLYAYAFPTFSNRLWWDWRYNSYGWNNWYYGNSWGFGSSWGWGHYPYYSGGWYPGGWHYGGWYSNGGGYWGGNHWGDATYTNRRYTGSRTTTAGRRTVGTSRVTGATRQSASGQVRRTDGGTSTRRVVGTRNTTNEQRPGTRTDAASSRRSTYTRPSSTRSTSPGSNVGSSRSSSTNSYSTGSGAVRGSSTRGSSGSTYSRGSSSRSVNNNNNSNSRSYDTNRSSSSSSRSSSGFSSGGSSSRSSGGSYSGGGGSSRSGGGGGSRRR